MVAAKQEELAVKGTENLSLYKYCFGKGNNANMVKALFKNRFWWANSERNDMEKVNFMWTQIKNAAHMETLLCKYPERKSAFQREEGR